MIIKQFKNEIYSIKFVCRLRAAYEKIIQIIYIIENSLLN